MTREEAIEHFEAQAQCNYAPTREAAQMAINALRAQPMNLDRSRWEGCTFCRVRFFVKAFSRSRIFGTHIYLKIDDEFCPMCGRPLTEEAWTELEQRIGGAQ